MLCADGRHSTPGRHRDPGEDNTNPVRSRLKVQDLGGWLALMKGLTVSGVAGEKLAARSEQLAREAGLPFKRRVPDANDWRNAIASFIAVGRQWRIFWRCRASLSPWSRRRNSCGRPMKFGRTRRDRNSWTTSPAIRKRATSSRKRAASARCAGGGRGWAKRGGVRVIYFYHNPATPLFLLMVYAKTVREDVTPSAKKALAEFAVRIKRAADG